MKTALMILQFLVLCNGAAGQTQVQPGPGTVIYIIRHAEKQGGKNPLLTAEGNARAGDLMRTLKDHGIKKIYVSQFRRTHATADSLRIQYGIDTVHYPADSSCDGLFEAISSHGDWKQPILVVSHSNLIQKIIYKLGVGDFPQQDIPDHEFDNLYRISYKREKAILQKAKYGKASFSYMH